VSGTPGAHQRDTFVLFKCDATVRLSDLDPSQNQRTVYQAAPCPHRKEGEASLLSLNTDHKLAKGIYYIRYLSWWGQLIEVNPGQLTEVKLGRIDLNTEDPDIVARFFMDLSEQELRHKWFVNLMLLPMQGEIQSSMGGVPALARMIAFSQRK